MNLHTRQSCFRSGSDVPREWVRVGRSLVLLNIIVLILSSFTEHLWTWDRFLRGGQDFELSLLAREFGITIVLGESDLDLALLALPRADELVLAAGNEGAASGSASQPAVKFFDTFPDLRKARIDQDTAIETFFANADEAFLDRPLSYINSRGMAYTDAAPRAVLHFFNHQTHHRGQAHAILTVVGVTEPDPLDLLIMQREQA